MPDSTTTQDAPASQTKQQAAVMAASLGGGARFPEGALAENVTADKNQPTRPCYAGEETTADVPKHECADPTRNEIGRGEVEKELASRGRIYLVSRATWQA